MGDQMEFQFDCGCGEQVSDFTRGKDEEITTRVRCSGCDTVYALTLTPIVKPES
jgi:hypothetical protein